MPAPLTLKYLIALFPEFSNEPQNRITVLDQTANLLVSEGRFGDQFLYAKALMVAHMIALGRQKGKGMVTDQRIGDIGRSYAGPGQISSGLYLTTYGMQYVTLAKMRTAGPYMVPQVPPFPPDQSGFPQ